jgi:hypothetical protein
MLPMERPRVVNALLTKLVASAAASAAPPASASA